MERLKPDEISIMIVSTGLVGATLFMFQIAVRKFSRDIKNHRLARQINNEQPESDPRLEEIALGKVGMALSTLEQRTRPDNPENYYYHVLNNAQITACGIFEALRAKGMSYDQISANLETYSDCTNLSERHQVRVSRIHEQIPSFKASRFIARITDANSKEKITDLEMTLIYLMRKMEKGRRRQIESDLRSHQSPRNLGYYNEETLNPNEKFIFCL